tara:strand:- start:300 stop:473 length:174 start_codon:yes stop_codon:yes gene_type:complete
MIRIELVRDPSGREDDFVVIDLDGEMEAYRHTRFKVDVEGNRKNIIPCATVMPGGDK